MVQQAQLFWFILLNVVLDILNNILYSVVVDQIVFPFYQNGWNFRFIGNWHIKLPENQKLHISTKENKQVVSPHISKLHPL